jgi:superfamily I DNA/RNA helicase
VIAAASLVPRLTERLAADLPELFTGPDPRGAVLTVAEVKGLEFDDVVLAEPADLLGESDRGASDIYVALTRATQRLVVVHADPLPPMLSAFEATISS